ncbi:MAG: AGE family epimerase/isomerase [Verrucomicrobia bacterium]|nr:AGE family epimerase/isomerase [Verrucomicrobiota bacterium]
MSAAALALTLLPSAVAKDLPDYAREFKAELIEKVMPYWFDTAVDWERGGYLLADDLKGKGEARDKQLVTQSRMVWGFSHAHLHGLGDGKRDYVKAARNGYRFLLDHFLDKENGGYFWKTDLAGKPSVDCKFLYGESFVIYALVEYYRASGDREALRQAMDLYQAIQKHCHHAQHGGWVEHTERDWRPLPPGDRRNEVEVVGLRSANAHLHWMEALAELYDATRDKAVKKSLAEALRLNQRYFYPKDAGQSCFHRHPDWSEVTDPKSAGLSYGHNVEFAWLMARAEQVLGRRPSWPHFYAHIDHALRYGYDHQRGGLYNRGFDNQPAADTAKVWWAEAELIAALSDALKHRPNRGYEEALAKQIDFLRAHQIVAQDGIWLDTVDAEGKPKSTGKAHNWKANYHDVRALVKFIEAFPAK